MPSFLTRPSTEPAESPLAAFLAASSMPGDLAVLASSGARRGRADGVWARMGRIVRIRSLHVEGQMSGFNAARRGAYDLTQFRRALSNAFDNQWHELCMTSAEFQEIAEPYTTRPTQGYTQGGPGGLVHWRAFAHELQHFAESERSDGSWAQEHTAGHADRVAKVGRQATATEYLSGEYSVTETELRLAFAYFKERLADYSRGTHGLADGFRRIDTDHKGTISAVELSAFFTGGSAGSAPWFVNERTVGVLVDWADLNGDDEIDFGELSAVLLCDDLLELAALVPDKKLVSQQVQDAARIFGQHGVPIGDVLSGHRKLSEKLLLWHKGGQQVVRWLDFDGSGTLTRAEIKYKCAQFNIISKRDPGTGLMLNGVPSQVLDTILDICDGMADGMGRPTEQQTGNVDQLAFTRGFFTQDAGGSLVDIFTVAGIDPLSASRAAPKPHEIRRASSAAGGSLTGGSLAGGNSAGGSLAGGNFARGSLAGSTGIATSPSRAAGYRSSAELRAPFAGLPVSAYGLRYNPCASAAGPTGAASASSPPARSAGKRSDAFRSGAMASGN